MPKRVRESGSVNTALVEIYEDLAHENESFRLKAAHKLLKNHVSDADHDTLVGILKRLFRGLCSSRKAARLGFSVALTEILTLISTEKDVVSATETIGILESQTVPESNTSGQDERDHYFGRLFGSDAIIKSGILFMKPDLTQWHRLLDLICGISIKKPWLRQECGWVLLQCVSQGLTKWKLQEFAVAIVEKLSQHKLVRSPEGLAIFIEIRNAFPNAQMPKSTWKSGNPLTAKEVHTLAKMLKDIQPHNKDGDDNEVQGSSTWSGNLHYVWDKVMRELTQVSVDRERVSFEEFWQVVVDDGLFAPNNSVERKHWGLLLLEKAFLAADANNVLACFSKNAINCLMHSLKTNDRYLQKTARKALQAMELRGAKDTSLVLKFVSAILIATDMVDFDAFTKTKTLGLFISVWRWKSPDGMELARSLEELLHAPRTDDAADATLRRKTVIGLQFKLITKIVQRNIDGSDSPSMETVGYILDSWLLATRKTASPVNESPAYSDATLTFIRERISLAFEQALKIGRNGRFLVFNLISRLQGTGQEKGLLLNADAEINQLAVQGWTRIAALRTEAYGDLEAKPTPASKKPEPQLSSRNDKNTVRGTNGWHSENPLQTSLVAEGMALLYSLTMFQIYNDDLDAVTVLGDLIELEQGAHHDASRDGKGSMRSLNANGLVEVILSFASRPSKFLRRITVDVFGSFTSQITLEGLQSLIDILETKETKAGQQELFEAKGVNDEADDIDSEDDSDVEMLDSDVEMVSASNDESSSEASSDSDSKSETAEASSTSSSASDSEDEDDNVDEKDEDLLALETSLAAALGTRKLTSDDVDGVEDSSSDSDADMTDSEMIALDEKLADVFRARQAQSNKKNEQKSAKENIVNFKNRVLDLIEVYFKMEVYQKIADVNPDSLRLVLPLLSLARRTNTKQLANRALDLLKAFCGKCKGLQNVPTLIQSQPAINVTTSGKSSKSKSKVKSKHEPRAEDDSSTLDAFNNLTTTDRLTAQDALLIFQSIHTEASLPNTSNAHRAACSQSSLLLVKVLLKAGVAIETLVGVYASTRVDMLTDPKCHVNERFFIDWGNWCGSMRGKLGAKSED